MNRPEPVLELHPRFRHVARSDHELVLIGEDDVVFVDDPDAMWVLDAVDGTSDAFAVAERLAERVDPVRTHFVLISLEEKQVIRHRGTPGVVDLPETAVEALARNLRRAWERRSNWATVVDALGVSGPSRIVLTDDYLSPDVRRALSPGGDTGGTALLCGLGHRLVSVGPSIIEDQTACLACVQKRLRVNLPARAWALEGAGGKSHVVRRVDRPFPPSSYQALARCLLSHDPATNPGLLTTVDVEHHVTGRHVFRRLPDCAQCGDPSLSSPGSAISVRSRSKVPESESGFRIRTPDQTLERLDHLISPLAGVIKEVEQVEVADAGMIHVYTTNHAYHLGRPSLEAARDQARDLAGGKGMTGPGARASAVCEAVERYSAVHRPSDPVEVRSIRDIERPFHAPNDLMLFSDAQFERRGEWNAGAAGAFQWIPERYDRSAIAWSTVRSLHDGQLFRVPSVALYLNFSGDGDRFCRGDSNGLASGNCVEEAILQAFCELVERDSVALWWYNRALRPRVDIVSFGDSYLESVVNYYGDQGLEMWVLDLTTDLALPSFVALSAAAPPDRELIFGFGCHLDPLVALRRAVTELNQMLPTVRRSAEERRAQLLPEFADAISWWESVRLGDHEYLRGLSATRTAADFRTPANTDLRDDVEHCLAAARRVGLTVLAYDLTRPDVSFPTVRVFVPGLRHFWRRLGPGRLYDVPTRLGWLDQVRPETDMNPLSVFV